MLVLYQESILCVGEEDGHSACEAACCHVVDGIADLYVHTQLDE